MCGGKWRQSRAQRAISERRSAVLGLGRIRVILVGRRRSDSLLWLPIARRRRTLRIEAELQFLGSIIDGVEGRAVRSRVKHVMLESSLGQGTPRSGQLAVALPTEDGGLMRGGAKSRRGTTYMMGDGTEQGLVLRGRQLEERGFDLADWQCWWCRGCCCLLLLGKIGLLSPGACSKLAR